MLRVCLDPPTFDVFLPTSKVSRKTKLTVVHLQDAMSARYFREVVANCGDVRLVRVFFVPIDVSVDPLASFVRSARRS